MGELTEQALFGQFSAFWRGFFAVIFRSDEGVFYPENPLDLPPKF